jgi:hypothetical protein
MYELRKLDKALEPGSDAITIFDEAEGALKAMVLIEMDLRTDVTQTPPKKSVRTRLPARWQKGAKVYVLLASTKGDHGAKLLEHNGAKGGSDLCVEG